MHNPLAQQHIGCFSELTAALWLLKQGLQVFRNISSHGPVDLVVLDPKTGQTTLYDVKSIRNLSCSDLNADQRQLGVQLLFVNPDTGLVTESRREAVREARINSQAEKDAKRLGHRTSLNAYEYL